MKNIKTIIAGVDEAGRGPLAGPVVAAAVIIPADYKHKYLRDSKKLSHKQREGLYDDIIENCVSYAIARAEVAEIDDINILQASLLAMHRAVDGLAIKPDHVMIDGNQKPKWNYSCEAIVKGDQLIPCISAASILAKVSRDREMLELARKYPNYGFEQHKGYPTKMHIQRLQYHGPCDIHRKTFAPVKNLLETYER